ncbi:MerR family transcriptional regulator [Streptomyces hilarionis]|uniref:MerR family transcriptional regulator n=1 Tax=Streptomyces hilarionis TaxID=2839954 RepID=UPI00211A39F5|nr:MerR family transcriptional regulator [Streptomyces hilarionis]MCQ9129215.1 MerR family transcriptional regulator [Streptomyces hilarionis]
MLIGELAAQTATTTRALRYYEEQGLLESDRTGAGYRTYKPGAVSRVRNVRELLASGFTVEDVKSFVRYLDTDLPEVFEYSPSCADGYIVGAQRVAELDERIAALTRLRDTLVHRMPWLAARGDTADSEPPVPGELPSPSAGADALPAPADL